MGRFAIDKALVKVVIQVAVRIVFMALAALGFGDLVEEPAFKEILSTFLEHIVTAVFLGIAIWDTFRKPEVRAKVAPLATQVKSFFLEEAPQDIQ